MHPGGKPYKELLEDKVDIGGVSLRRITYHPRNPRHPDPRLTSLATHVKDSHFHYVSISLEVCTGS